MPPTSLKDFLNTTASPLQISNVDTWEILSPICKVVTVLQKELQRLDLNPNLQGNADSTNKTGDQQKKFDLFANQVFIKYYRDCPVMAGMVSEEEEDFLTFDFDRSNPAFVIQLDPIDGSSNMAINHPVGTIFSIYPKQSASTDSVQAKDFLQSGDQQVLAGYLMFGFSTLMVLTTGNGVYGFLFDQEQQAFFLAYDNIKIPENGSTLCANERNRPYWDAQTIAYIDSWETPDDSGKRRSASSRCCGAFFGDFHRCLFNGGIYLRPSTSKHIHGKLRLLYECNPLAFIVEQAGGKATDGKKRILEKEPTSIHQTSPVIIGSQKMVEGYLMN